MSGVKTRPLSWWRLWAATMATASLVLTGCGGDANTAAPTSTTSCTAPAASPTAAPEDVVRAILRNGATCVEIQLLLDPEESMAFELTPGDGPCHRFDVNRSSAHWDVTVDPASISGDSATVVAHSRLARIIDQSRWDALVGGPGIEEVGYSETDTVALDRVNGRWLIDTMESNPAD